VANRSVNADARTVITLPWARDFPMLDVSSESLTRTRGPKALRPSGPKPLLRERLPLIAPVDFQCTTTFTWVRSACFHRHLYVLRGSVFCRIPPAKPHWLSPSLVAHRQTFVLLYFDDPFVYGLVTQTVPANSRLHGWKDPKFRSFR